MTKRILIMGLPGSGKTNLASELADLINPVLWLNGDKIRSKYCDWDFSHEGRIRQARRMRALADEYEGTTIIDFVCPLKEMREIIKPDVLIWMNTIDSGRYDDTNTIFEKPDAYDICIKTFENLDLHFILEVIEHA
jgi:adenylylsulfate kinase